MTTENILYKELFASGYVTINGKYTLRYPLWFRAVLTVLLTNEKIKITAIGIPVFEEKFPNITKIQINIRFASPAVDIISSGGKGFLFYTRHPDKWAGKFQELKLPLLYDKSAVQKYMRFLSPLFTMLGIIAGIAIIFFAVNCFYLMLQ